MRSCDQSQLDRIRPNRKADDTDVVCTIGDEVVDADIEYEDRFVDGGGSGSSPASGPVEEGSSADVVKAKTMKTPMGPSSIEKDNHDA